MKKIASIFLIAFMLISVFPTFAFAANEKSETFICDGKTCVVEGDNFSLSSVYIEHGGWTGGSELFPLTITAHSDKARITHIDAHISYYATFYEEVGISRGDKVQESFNVMTPNEDASIININNKEFAFIDGSRNVPFDRITVYFESCNDGEHLYDENYVCVTCGVTKCTAEGHSIVDGFCELCGKPCEHESELTRLIVSAEKVVCPDCDEVLSLTEITKTQKTASAFASSNLTIIVGIASAVIFGIGGFIIGKKKK